MLKVLWTPHAWNDYVWWQFEDRKTLKRINALIADIRATGTRGSASLSLSATNTPAFGRVGSTDVTDWFIASPKIRSKSLPAASTTASSIHEDRATPTGRATTP